MRYFIVDDDRASRMMLKQIIEDSHLGVVIGEASNGEVAIPQILMTQPDFVLIDLLMPKLDGIATIEQLRKSQFQGQFIMISQVVNKEMVGEAYLQGVDFFIHKPINRIEVTSVLQKTLEQFRLKSSILAIRQSISSFDMNTTSTPKKSTRELIQAMLNDMGILGEIGSKDILDIIEYLLQQPGKIAPLPPLKELYEAIAMTSKTTPDEILKECKAIEQRIRRTILAAMINIASLGVVDYTNAEFEYYAPRYFDFKEIRLLMKQIEDNSNRRAKVNIKKFILVLYNDIFSKIN